MTDYDVVVLGTGIAGLCAALTAADEGARVLVVDKEPDRGGRSQYSSGIVMAAGTRFQRERGIEDSADALFHHYMTLNQWKVDVGPVRALCTEMGPAMEWLDDLGAGTIDILFSGDELVPRGHVTRGGQALTDATGSAAWNHPRIDFAMGRRVGRLLIEDGRVTGVATGSDELTAGAVVLAVGGLTGSPELMAEYLPGVVAHAGDWLYPNGDEDVAHYSRGDGIPLARQANAVIAGHDRAQIAFRPNFSHESDPYFPGWLVIVNGEGRRFYDEMAPYSVTQTLVEAQPGPLFALFDDAAKKASQPKSTAAFKKVVIPDRTWEDWIEPVIDEMVEAGRVTTADTVAGLAEKIGLPPETLAGTVEVYNDDVAAGQDRAFLKKPEVLRPVATPPFYAAEVRLRQINLTGVGPRITADAQVRTNAGPPVPGLFAAGECLGGVLGPVYVGSGNGLAIAIGFGRIAGRSAAKAALS